MPDREKVVRDLENLGAWHTHHYAPFHYEAAETIHNATVLLREQEPAKPVKFQTEALTVYHCRSCTTEVGLLFSNEDTWRFHYHFCPRCGREVKWDD